MLVNQILSNKGIAEVFTIKPDTSVADAASLLSTHKIGAVIVAVEADQPDGILSERDIVRELGRNGADVLVRPVSDLMTRNIVGCAPEDNAIDVLEKMTEGRFRHMPVMKDGKMVGLVSIGDVVKGRLAELAMERDALEGMVMGH